MTATRPTVTIAEGARRAGMTANGLRYWISRGAVSTVPTPLGRVVVKDSLDRFLESRKEKRHGAAASPSQ